VLNAAEFLPDLVFCILQAIVMTATRFGQKYDMDFVAYFTWNMAVKIRKIG